MLYGSQTHIAHPDGLTVFTAVRPLVIVDTDDIICLDPINAISDITNAIVV
jgi:hypothetical protein